MITEIRALIAHRPSEVVALQNAKLVPDARGQTRNCQVCELRCHTDDACGREVQVGTGVGLKKTTNVPLWYKLG